MHATRWRCEAGQLTLLVMVTSESWDMECLRMPRGTGAEGSKKDGDRGGGFRAASGGTPPCRGSGASSIMREVGGADKGLAVRLQ